VSPTAFCSLWERKNERTLPSVGSRSKKSSFLPRAKSTMNCQARTHADEVPCTADGDGIYGGARGSGETEGSRESHGDAGEMPTIDFKHRNAGQVRKPEMRSKIWNTSTYETSTQQRVSSSSQRRALLQPREPWTCRSPWSSSEEGRETSERRRPSCARGQVVSRETCFATFVGVVFSHFRSVGFFSGKCSNQPVKEI
jgi:hypothetical protein